MRGKRLLAVVAFLVVTLALAVTACGGSDEGSGDSSNDLVIGVINSITGSNALTGAEQKWAQEKAAADINEKGGIKLSDGEMHKVVLKFVDDKSQPSEGAAAMEKLIKTDGIKIILGSNITPINQAAATVAEREQAYFHMNTSWTDEASPDGSFPGFIGGMDLAWSTVIFESAADAGKVVLGSTERLPDADRPKNFAIMTENTPDGEGFGLGTKAMLEGAGYKVVAWEKFVEGNKDFSSIILKFKEAGTDGVVTLIAPTDGITFVKQMKEQDWSPKYVFGFKGFWPVEFYDALGTDADYIGHDGFWTETYPYPYAKELGQAFRDDHDGNASVTVGLPYAAAQILFTAIERAGEFEPGAVRDEVFNGEFPGTTMGDITYNDQGVADIPFLAFQWKDGEHPVVWPEEFASEATQPFVPWSER